MELLYNSLKINRCIYQKKNFKITIKYGRKNRRKCNRHKIEYRTEKISL